MNAITVTRVIIYLFIIVCFKFVVFRTISDLLMLMNSVATRQISSELGSALAASSFLRAKVL